MNLINLLGGNEHLIVLGAALGVAVLDLVFALNPKVEANGLLHAVYLFAKKIANKDKPQ